MSFLFKNAVGELGKTSTIDGAIAPKYQTVSFTSEPGETVADACFFIANDYCKVIAIRQVHSVAGSDGSAVSLQVTKDTSTDAPGAGTDLLTNNTNAGFNLKSTANTVQTGTLTATLAALKLAPGDRLSVDLAGTATAVEGVVVSVQLERYNL